MDEGRGGNLRGRAIAISRPLRRLLVVGALSTTAAGVPVDLGAQSACAPLDAGMYLDVAYLHSDNEPGNNEWRTKGTSSYIGGVTANNVTAFFQKEACADSRWGVQAGLQGGRDINALVPPDSISSAETLKHLYYTNVSYLAPLGNGLLLTGGLIPGNVGYESFWAIDNPTYTRVYSVDWVPYFQWGVNATYPLSGRVETSLLVVSGWDYLAAPNGLPSFGFQVTWETARERHLRLTLYYGPEQEQTALDLWRLVGEFGGVHRFGHFAVAAKLGYGSEKQADVAGNPRYHWVWGSAWFRWQALDWLRLALRPEFFSDPDGLAAGTRQEIGAIATAVNARIPWRHNDIHLRVEYRFDRSTGPEGGFYQGPDNVLVPNQNLLIAALNWRFRALGN